MVCVLRRSEHGFGGVADQKGVHLIDGERESKVVVVIVAVADGHEGLVVAVVDLVHRLKGNKQGKFYQKMECH